MSTLNVVVPCYNYGRHLTECVESVLGQDVSNLRVLVIDDASTDNTASVARALADRDERVEVRSHPKNIGHIATYNEGIDWATGGHFLLLSADDLLAPGAASRALDVMDRNPKICMTFGREALLRPGDGIPAPSPRDGHPRWVVTDGIELIESCCRTAMNLVGTSTAIVRTEAQKQAGHYRPELPHSGDLEMWLRLACLGHVAQTHSTQGIRRLHGINMSEHYRADGRDIRQREEAFESFFSREGRDVPDAHALWKMAREALAEDAFRCGETLLRARDYAGARLLMGLACGLSPSAPLTILRSRFAKRQRPFRRLAPLLDRVEEKRVTKMRGPDLATVVDPESEGRLVPQVTLKSIRTPSGSEWAARRILAAVPDGSSHLLLAPWLERGGAELVLLKHLDHLLGAGRRPALVLTEISASPWLRRVNEEIAVIEAGELLARLSDRERSIALARVIVQSQVAVVHNINSCCAWQCIARFGGVIRANASIFVSLYCQSGQRNSGYAGRFLPRTDANIDGYISDNANYLSTLRTTFGIEARKLHIAYVPTEQVPGTLLNVGAPRVLWAGRLDGQKRPDLLLAIAKQMPWLAFDVYGASTNGKTLDLQRELAIQPNIELKGAYDGFETVPFAGYGCLLHTSAYDGIPNVLLEAGARGMAVVASDVGGVGELITEQTGWLVQADSVSSYIGAILSAMDGCEAARRGGNLRELVRARHSARAFARSLGAIPGYLSGDPSELVSSSARAHSHHGPSWRSASHRETPA